MNGDRIIGLALFACLMGALAQAVSYVEAHGIHALAQAVIGH